MDFEQTETIPAVAPAPEAALRQKDSTQPNSGSLTTLALDHAFDERRQQADEKEKVSNAEHQKHHDSERVQHMRDQPDAQSKDEEAALLRNPERLEPGEHDPPEGTRASAAKRARKGGQKGRAEARGEPQPRTEDGKQRETAPLAGDERGSHDDDDGATAAQAAASGDDAAGAMSKATGGKAAGGRAAGDKGAGDKHDAGNGAGTEHKAIATEGQ